MRKENICATHSLKILTATLVSIVILISTTGHIALTSIYNYLPLLFILNFLHPQQVPQQVLVLFLEEWPTPLFLMGMCALSFYL